MSGLLESKTFTVLSAVTLLNDREMNSLVYEKLFKLDGGDATTKGQIIVLRDSSGSNTYSGALKNPRDPGSEFWTTDPVYPDVIK